MPDPEETEAPDKEPEQPEPSETPQAPAPQETPAVKEAPKAPADPKATAETLVTPYEAVISNSGKSKADRIRDVLSSLHEKDANVLNSDVYPKIKAKLAEKLSCSPALVDKSKKEVLAVKQTDASDAPAFPDRPAGSTEPAAPGPTAPGAPFAPIPSQTGGEDRPTLPAGTETAAPDEPMVWDKRKAGRIMAMLLNMPGWMLEEWERLTPEERDELGDSFKEVFQEFFPTTKKTGYLLFSLAAIEAMIRPRTKAVIQYRMRHKTLAEVKEQLRKEIAELHKEGDD